MQPLGYSLVMFNAALKGDFAPVSTFEAFNDDSLRHAILRCYSLVMTIPDTELQGLHHKLASCFEFLKLVTEHSMTVLLDFPAEHLSHLVEIICSGLGSFEQDVRLHSYATVYHVCRFLFFRLRPDAPQPEGLEERGFVTELDCRLQKERISAWLAQNPNFIPALQRTIIKVGDFMPLTQMVIEGHVPSSWLLSRALLGLVLLDSDSFRSLSQGVAAGYGSRSEEVSGLFDELVSGVAFDMTASNIEYFARRVHTFAQVIQGREMNAEVPVNVVCVIRLSCVANITKLVSAPMLLANLFLIVALGQDGTTKVGNTHDGGDFQENKASGGQVANDEYPRLFYEGFNDLHIVDPDTSYPFNLLQVEMTGEEWDEQCSPWTLLYMDTETR